MTTKELGCDKVCNECAYGGDYYYDKKSKECIARPLNKTKEQIRQEVYEKYTADQLKYLYNLFDVTLEDLINQIYNKQNV